MRRFLITLVVVASAHGQGLDQVLAEAKAVRAAPGEEFQNYADILKAIRNRSVGLQAALRDWIEPQLPANLTNVDAELTLVKARFMTELDRAGLMGQEFEPKPGFVSRIELSHLAEAPEFLVVIVGTGVPCGSDDVVYVYDYSKGAPRRMLESHGTRDSDEGVRHVQFSKRDASGSRLILTLRFSAQCGSSWMALSYDLFRLPGAALLLAKDHSIWLGMDPPYNVRLEPSELLLEFRDRSIDMGIHNRTHVLHYRIDESSSERIDPVALLPQDFVDEWLTRPWSEMQSRSVENKDEALKK